MWRTKTWGGQRWYHGVPQGHAEGFVLDSKGDRSHWGLDPFASWDSASAFMSQETLGGTIEVFPAERHRGWD